jgi:hypothetical protein
LVKNQLEIPFEIAKWNSLVGTGKCNFCAKAFDFRLTDSDTASKTLSPEGFLFSENLNFKLDLSNENVQIKSNNYVSKFNIKVKPMFTAVGTNLFGNLCLNFSPIWRMP